MTNKYTARMMADNYARVADALLQKQWQENSAHDFLNAVHALTGTSLVSIRVEDFLAGWLKTKKTTAAAKSYQNIEYTIGHFLEHLGAASKGPIGSITPHVVAGYRDKLIEELSPNTVNKALSFLRQAMVEAVAQGALEKNPVDGLRIKGAKKLTQKRKHFTFEQFKALVECFAPNGKAVIESGISSEWRTFLLIGAYTGGRQQELAKAEWDGVNFDRMMITLDRTKTKDSHWLPLHPSLHQHLLELKNGTRPPIGRYLMPTLAKFSVQKISKIFREQILPLNSITQPYENSGDKHGYKRKLAAFSVHSLRHSLSTWLHEAGVSEAMRMEIVGHEDKRVSRGYTHTSLEQAAAALAKVPQL